MQLYINLITIIILQKKNLMVESLVFHVVNNINGIDYFISYIKNIVIFETFLLKLHSISNSNKLILQIILIC